MRQVTIYSTRDFVVVSYGNGLAYDFQNKRTDESVFFQGDDATQFREELDSAWRKLGDLWSDYSDIAQPRDEITRRG